MLTSVVRAHAGVRLLPHQQVFPLGVHRPCSGKHFFHVTVVHEEIMQGTVHRVGRQKAECGLEEPSEFRTAHLATGHRKFAMLMFTQS